MSGPGGLAAYLRSHLLDAPCTAKSLPLDVGSAKDIPAAYAARSSSAISTARGLVPLNMLLIWAGDA